MKIINEDYKQLSFIELFKNIDIVREYNSIAGIDRNIVVSFKDPSDSYSNYFSDYKTFKRFILEEYNNGSDLLKAKFIIGQPFIVPCYGDDFSYVIDLVIE